MKTLAQKRNFSLSATIATLLLVGWSTMLYATEVTVVLSGANEVPPVTTTASGMGKITIAPDKTVSGSVTTVGVAATMAHIHVGRSGQVGPVLIPLKKTGDNVWSVPEGAKLPDTSYNDFEAGKLYVNVHSEAHPGGEIRGQLVTTPKMKDESMLMPGTAGGGSY